MIKLTSHNGAGAARIRRALGLVWQSGPGWAVASVALVVVQGVVPLLVLYLMKLVIDTLATSVAAPDDGMALGRVMSLVGLVGVAVLIGAVARSFAGLVAEGQAQAVTAHMHDVLHAKSIEVDLEYYEDARYYDTLHRAQQDASSRPSRVLQGLVQVAQNGVSLLAMAGLLLSFHWGIAAILFVAAVPGVFVRVKYADQLYRWQRRRTPTERRRWYFHWLITGIIHAKEIRLFNLGPVFMREFRDAYSTLRRERLRIATRRSVAESATQVTATLAVLGSYLFIAYQAVLGRISVGDLMMYYLAFQRGQDFLRELLTGLAGLYEDALFLTSLDEFLGLKRKVDEPVAPRPIPRPMRTGISFEHVSFRYPSGARNVLQDITLTIRPGEHVAFVGLNGSGKTTLIKLLCRLYDPTDGRITIDGVDLRQLETAALRREISIIFQDYAQYHLTARENIWFGNTDVAAADDRIQAAARYSGADRIIARLKDGYDTVLGKWLQDGEELSVGEWQTVALGRAFLRDAQIIVLDEPTSALDPSAEYALFRRFRRLAENRTAILISHRFSTVRMADCIYVLENGRLVERGTHAELVDGRGRYAALFETQAQFYR